MNKYILSKYDEDNYRWQNGKNDGSEKGKNKDKGKRR